MRRPELDYHRIAELKARAAIVLKHHACAVPVDPKAIIANEDELRLHYDDFGDAFEGAIEYDQRNDKYDIFINTRPSGLAVERERFTLSHELGHFFIKEHQFDLADGKVPSYRFGQSVKNLDFAEALAELEADCFASHLLVPEDELKAEMAKVKGAEGTLSGLIGGLADHFKVSFECAANRFVTNTDLCCALAVYPRTPFRVPWVEVSTSFQKRFKVSRNSKLAPYPTAAGYLVGIIGEWFEDVLPSLRGEPVRAKIVLSTHGAVALLRSSS